MSRLRAALGIRPGEGQLAGRFLAMMVVVWAAFAVGANAIESLFFARFGPSFLPYLYLGLGAATCLVIAWGGSLVARPGQAGRLASVPVVLAGAVLGMRALLEVDARWLYPALWLAMMVAWTVQTSAGWALAGAVHDTRQAKRLFPLYGAAVVLGTAVGGLATGALARWLHAENLLYLWAAGLTVGSVLARGVARSVPPAPRAGRAGEGVLRSLVSGARGVARSPLLRWMAVAVVGFALLYFSVGFLFARVATARFPQADRLAAFLGLIMAASSAAALAVSVGLSARLFARFGLATMVLVLPVVYLVGFLGLVAGAAFTIVVAFRLIQLVWVNGVWATGWQAMFNVVPAERRGAVRTFMDGVAFQAGIVGAGVVLIAAEHLLDVRGTAVLLAAVAAGATVAMIAARRSYGTAVLEALRAGNPEVFLEEEGPFGGPLRDAAARQVVLDGLRSADAFDRRVSAEILSEADVPGVSDALKQALDDDDPLVRAAALRGLVKSGDATAAHAARFVRDQEPVVRAAALDAVATAVPAGEHPALLGPLLSDEDPALRARAAALLMDGAGAEVLRSMGRSRDPEARRAAIGALGRSGRTAAVIEAAVGDDDPSVRRAAVRELRSSPRSASIDPLVRTLGDPDPGVRAEAVGALLQAGEPVRERVEAALSDPDLESGAVRVLSGLPGTSSDLLEAYAGREVARACRLGSLLGVLDRAGGRVQVIAHALRHGALEHAVDALEAVGGLGDPTAVRVVIDNLGSRDPVQRANALEMLEAHRGWEVVRPLVRIWDAPEGPPSRDGAAAALRELLHDEDPWVRAAAAFAGTGLDDPAVRDAIAGLAASDPDRLVRETAARAGGTVEAISVLSLMERVLFLQQVPLFRELSPADVKQLAEVAGERTYRDGDVIAAQGERGDEMYVVVEGEVRVVLRHDGGEDEHVASRGPGYIVGEMSILGDHPRMASLVAAGTVRTLSIDRSRFHRILRERPDAALAVMAELSARLRAAHEHERTAGS